MDATTALTNTYLLFELTSNFGQKYLKLGNGAWGVPAQAMKTATMYRDQGHRTIVGTRTTDVTTGCSTDNLFPA
jgi:hypothetical protein